MEITFLASQTYFSYLIWCQGYIYLLFWENKNKIVIFCWRIVIIVIIVHINLKSSFKIGIGTISYTTLYIIMTDIFLQYKRNMTIWMFYWKCADERDHLVDNQNIYNVEEDHRLSPCLKSPTTAKARHFKLKSSRKTGIGTMLYTTMSTWLYWYRWFDFREWTSKSNITSKGKYYQKRFRYLLTWFIRYIYDWNLQYPHNIIITKTTILLLMFTSLSFGFIASAD